MTMFGLLEPRPAFTAYLAGITDRDAYRRGKKLDEDAAAALNG